jgi:hypothetical protein
LNAFLYGEEMQRDQMKKIIDDYIKSYNSFDIDGMLRHMHKNISFQNISDGQVNMSTHGIAELRAAAEQVKAIFKSRCQNVTNYQFIGDTAKVEIDYEAELATDIPNGPKAGDILKLKGISEFIFKEGLVFKLTDIS